jgi:hypothetical protein
VKKSSQPEVAVIVEREGDVEVDTSTGIWEIFSPLIGKLGKFTKGAYLDLTEVYASLSFTKSEVAENRKTKIAFMEAAVAYLKPLLERLGKRNLLLKLSPGSMSGAGLLLESKENQDESDYRLLRIELELVAVLRNREGQRNLWVAFSDVTSPRQLAELKSEVSNAGCRRSATFRIFASLERAVAELNIRELCEVGMDGFILDLPGSFAHLYNHEPVVVTESLINFFGFVVSQINKSKASSVVLQGEAQMSEKLLKSLTENGLNELILPPTLLNRVLPKLASLEVNKLKTKKRGRKKKQIDYGF